MTSILIVDDEPQLLRALRVTLTARSYDVETAATGRQAVEQVGSAEPDLVVLDLGLPDMDGVEIVQLLRGWTSVPIVVLSGRTQSATKVRALEAGADDYLTKPFQIEELVARIRAVARRSSGGDAQRAPVVELGDVTVDLHARRAVRRNCAEGETDVHLTRTEWQLVTVLLRNPGRLVPQRELIQVVRGPEYHDAAHYLRQYMAQLRRKLESEPARPRHLLTEPGMGYRFQP